MASELATLAPTAIVTGSCDVSLVKNTATQPAAISDSASGRLTIYGNAEANTVTESISAKGFVELTIDGIAKSADASTLQYDPRLAGLTRETLHEIVMIGGGGDDRLFLGDQSLSDGLRVDSDGSVTVAGSVCLGQRFEVTAAAIEIDGSVTAHGGFVCLRSSSLTQIQGTIDVSAAYGGVGGRVEILGSHVALVSSAVVNASGDQAGGTVLVGGDYQGGNPDIPNAQHVFVAETAQIHADALTQGQGGRVIVWADEVTRYYGTISARGGLEGGDGGFVEVSAKAALGFHGLVDALAPKGAAGTLLLDPKCVVVATGGLATLTGVDQFTDDPAGTDTIDPALINAAGANVAIQASTDITINAPIAMTGSGIALTLRAGRSIFINANVTTTNGAITMVANDNGATSVYRDAGAGDLTMSAGTALSTAAGIISLSIGSSVAAPFTPGTMTVANITTTSGAQTYVADEIDFIGGANSVIGTGAITLRAARTSTSIAIAGAADSGASVLDLTATDLAAIRDGFTSRAIGQTTAALGTTVTVNTATFVDPLTVIAGLGTLSVAGALTMGANALILQGDEINLTGGVNSLVGSSTLTFQQQSIGVSIAIGGTVDSGASVLDLTTTDLAAIQDGFSTITIGSTAATVATTTTVQTTAFTDRLYLRAGLGTLNVAGVLTMGANALSLQGNEIDLAGGANSVVGSSTLTLQQRGTGINIAVGGTADSGAGTLDLTTSDLAAIADGFSSITLGQTTSLAATTTIINTAVFTDPLSILAGLGTAYVAGTLNVGANALTIEGAEINLTGGANSLVGTSTLALRPTAAATPVVVGGLADSGVAVFDLTGGDLLALADGFAAITIGRADSTVNMTVNSAVFHDPVTLQSAGVGGNITLAAGATITSDTSGITFTAGTGNAGLFTQAAGARIVNTTGGITINADAIDLDGGANSIAGSGTLVLTPRTTTRSVVIGDPGTVNDFALSTTELGGLADGFSGITIGSNLLTGLATVYSATFADPIAILMGAAGGRITQSDALSTAAANAAITLTTGAGGTFTQTAGAGNTISAGGGSIAINTDNIVLNTSPNTISGAGSLTLTPTTASRPVIIGAAGSAANFALAVDELAALADGFAEMVIGSNMLTGLATISACTFTDPVTIRMGGTSGDILVSGALTAATPNTSIGLVAGTAGTIVLNAQVNAGSGNLTLNSGGSVTQAQTIIASGLELLGTSTFTLNLANDVDTLAADIVGSLSYFDVDDLTIGTVGSTMGIATGNPAAGGSVSITSSGYLTVNQTIDTSTGVGGILAATSVAISATPILGAGNILLGGLNHPPTLDLDADNSSGALGVNFSASFVEDGGVVNIADSDAVLTDVDSTTLTSLVVTITNHLDGANETLTANTSGTSISAAYNAATGVLTLSGVDTATHYQQVLRTISYNNVSQMPNTTARSISFVASDGIAASTSAVTTLAVTAVNDAPTSANRTVATNEDAAYTFALADFSFSDIEGDSLTKVQIAALPSQGTLQLAGVDVALNQDVGIAAILAGNLKFIPAANANGAGYDSFQFKVHDGIDYSASSYAMTVDVAAVNDLPTSADHTVGTSEDTAYTFTLADFPFSDVDGDSLAKVQITALEARGALQLSGVDVTLNQEIAAGDIVAGNLKFTPAANANGAGYDAFQFKVHDGAIYSALSHAITIDVAAVNDAPTSADRTATATEDTPYTFTLADFPFSDVDGDSLAKVQITALETQGTLQLSGVNVTLNQEITIAAIAAGDLKFIPAANANGAAYDSFQFKVHDGTAYSASSHTITIDVTPVNDAPTSADRTVTAVEDTPYTFSLADFPYTDVEGDGLAKVQIAALEARGSLQLSGVDVTLNQEIAAGDIAAGNLKFIPAANANGAGYDAFQFKVHDGTVYGILGRTMTIDVTAVNDAPTSADRTVTTAEDTSYTFTLADFPYSDVDGDSLAKIQVTALTSQGSLQLSGAGVTLNQEIAAGAIAAGNLKFIPAANANGAAYDAFQFKVHDGTTYGVAGRTMTIDVTAVNDAPTSADRTVTTNEDMAYVFTLADFPYSDVEGSGLTKIEITTLETRGSLRLSGVDVTLNQEITASAIAAGNLWFIPAANANGAAYDSFQFKVHDGTTYSALNYTATLNVTPVNDAPTSANRTVTTNEDASYTFSAADFPFSDVDGDSLAKIQVTALATQGSLQLSGVNVALNQEIAVGAIAAGNLKFVPAANASGAPYDFFQFKVHDGTICSVLNYTTTVNVTAVNDPPTSADRTVTTNEDTPYVFSLADFAYADVEGSSFTKVQITALTTRGSLQLSGVNVALNQEIAVSSIAAGNLRFIPVANANGAAYDAFQFKVHDGTTYSVLSNTTTINVTAINDSPTSADRTVTTNEDTAYTFSLADFAYADVEGSSLAKVQITALATRGSLQVSGVNVTLNQDILVAAIAAGNVKFTPAANANGTSYDTFQFKVYDGTAYSVLNYAMTVNVTAVNDLPTSADRTINASEDTPYAFTTADFPFSDVDGDSLAKIQVTALTSQGSLQLSGASVTLNQEIAASAIAAGYLKFIPAANANGAAYDTFRFKVSDGTAYSAASQTITVNVAAVNDAPSSADRTVSTAEDTPCTFTLADFPYSDIDGDSLTKVQITALETRGSLQLSGVDVTLNQEIAASAIAAGNLKFVPAANNNGAFYDAFQFRVHDGTVYSLAGCTMTINVGAVNDAPTSVDNTVATNEDSTYTFTLADFPYNDVEGDVLAKVRITSLETRGSLQLSGADVVLNQEIAASAIAAGTLKFTPAANANGAAYAVFQFKVHDGSVYSATNRSMTVDVTPVNDLPTSADHTVTTDEDTAYTFTLADLPFADIDGDSLAKVQITTLTSQGALQLSGTDVTLTQEIGAGDIAAGNLKFVPASNANGSPDDAFQFKVHDGTAYEASSHTMTINVTAVNDPPPSADRTVSTNEDTAYSFTLADFPYSDVEGDTFTKMQITSLEPQGVLQLSGVDVSLNQEIMASAIAAGNLRFIPAANASGPAYAAFQFKVHDGTDYSVSSHTMTIDVTAVNDPPTLDAIADPPAILEDAGTQTISLTGISPGGSETQLLQVTATSDNTTLIPNPTVTYTSPNGSGTLSCQSAAGQWGTAVITVTVRDAGLDGILGSGDDATVSRSFSVTVQRTSCISTVGLYEPGSSVFYVRNSNDAGYADNTFTFGPAGAGWLCIAGDWNGDGKDTVGLYDPITSTFYLRDSNDSGFATTTFAFGPVNSGWQPIAGDWDGDGKDSVGLYDPLASTFYLKNANATGYADATLYYGPAQCGWTPIAGDWNGDGTDTIGLYDQDLSVFYLKNANSEGYADVRFPYGPANNGVGWKPIAGDWDGDGKDTIGLFNPANSVLYLRNTTSRRNEADHGYADRAFAYGPSPDSLPHTNAFASGSNDGPHLTDWLPIAGNWIGTGHCLKATGSPASTVESTPKLTDADLQPIVDEAIRRWAAAGLDAAAVEQLAQARFQVTPLSGDELGVANGNRISIDSDAAGYGWFVDATAATDEEFTPSESSHRRQTVDARAIDRMDLLTVVEHELGHIAGLGNLDALADSIMAGKLSPGVRCNL